MKGAMLLLIVLSLEAFSACGGKLPETRFYQLAAPQTGAPAGQTTLVLEPLQTDGAYDDERIVYRTNPYRLDYYQYHRWSAAPGVMVGNYLEQALEHSGKFHAVVREATQDAPVILGGRVVAIEEIDDSKTHWTGHIVLELTLTDAKSGTTLWSEQYEENEPVPVRTPEGLAQALSKAMARISAKAAPIVSDLAERQAALHASGVPTVGRLAP